MRLGELSDDICNRLDPEITMKVIFGTIFHQLLLFKKEKRVKNESKDL
jgi:hypothetical protein